MKLVELPFLAVSEAIHVINKRHLAENVVNIIGYEDLSVIVVVRVTDVTANSIETEKAAEGGFTDTRKIPVRVVGDTYGAVDTAS